MSSSATVVNADCVAVMKKLRDQSVDFVFADPPYNLQLGGKLTRVDGTTVESVDEDWDRFDSFEDYDAFCRSWLVECQRILKPTGSIAVIGSYHNIYRIGAALQTLGFWIQNDIIWRKTNPMPNFRGTRLQNAQETIIWASPSRKKAPVFNYKALKGGNDDRQLRSDWLIPICQGAERLRQSDGTSLHPTQKPLRLLERLITMATLPGAVILDPFTGTGTTGVAARRLGRRFIGIEADASYAEVAKSRIMATAPYALREPEEAPPVRYPTMGELLDMGALNPGETLFTTRRGEDKQKETVCVSILATGEITDGILRGSIHGLAKEMKTGQSNGWMAWSLMRDGQLILLDEIRKAHAFDPETGEAPVTASSEGGTHRRQATVDRLPVYDNAPSIAPTKRYGIA